MFIGEFRSPPALLLIAGFRNHDGNANENITSRFLFFFVIIPVRSTCTMWPNYPVTERVRTAFKLIQRKENLPSCAHVIHKTLNLVISRCCLAKYGEELYQNLKRTCRAFVFSLFCDVLVAVAVVAS